MDCDADESRNSCSASFSATTVARLSCCVADVSIGDSSRAEDDARSTSSATIEDTTSSSSFTSSFTSAFTPPSSNDICIARCTSSSSLLDRLGDDRIGTAVSAPSAPCTPPEPSFIRDELVCFSASSSAQVSSIIRSISWLYPRLPMALDASG